MSRLEWYRRHHNERRIASGLPPVDWDARSGRSPLRWRTVRKWLLWILAIAILALVGLYAGRIFLNRTARGGAGATIGSGTAFFVTADGYAVTAAHVISKAKEITLHTRQGIHTARVVKLDARNDLALLKCDGRFPHLPIRPSAEAKLGQSVLTIGFPLPDVQGVQPKVTRGEISSLAGIQDDARLFQISAPVQPGNSGGPLLDESGAVVGVVVSRLSDTFLLQKRGIVPQNVNYAIKSAHLLALLESHPDCRPSVASKSPGASQDAEKLLPAVARISVAFR